MSSANGIGAAPLLRRTIYWRETEPVEPSPPLEGDVRADVCIVGGGYTGLWTAWHLKQAEPSLDVRVIEAEYAGAGASGHNDGFVTPTIGHSLHTVVRGGGPERARAAYAAAGRSIMDLRRFCRRQGVDADFDPSGFYLVATNDGQRRQLEHDAELAARMGFAYEVLERAEAREHIGSDTIVAALRNAGGVINPHKLARGLTRAVRDAGVEVHERTPALDVGRAGGHHVVTTPLARVSAERLVLATNAYQHQWAPFRHKVKPVWSYAMVSEPLSADRLAQVHWPERAGFVEARNFIVFARLTADHRLLVGGGPAPYRYGRDMGERHVFSLRAEQVLAAARDRFFPQWSDVRFTHAYGGCIAVTRDLVPHIGRLADGTCYAYGYCGNGIVMTQLAGRALRDIVLSRTSADTDLLFVGGREPAYPPEPLSFLGARALAAVLEFQDRYPGLVRRQLV